MRKEEQKHLLLPRNNALVPRNQARQAKSLLPTQLGKVARTAIDDHGLIPAKCIFWFLAGYSGYKLESIGSGRSVLKIFPQVLAGEPGSLQNSADDRRI